MIIWTGLGILVPIVWALILWGVESLFNISSTQQVSYSFFTAAVPVWFLGAYLNRPRWMLDETDRREKLVAPYHSFFFIRMQYWGAILIILGILALVFGWE